MNRMTRGSSTQGLVLAEVELDRENRPFTKPPWVGEEVTATPASTTPILWQIPPPSGTIPTGVPDTGCAGEDPRWGLGPGIMRIDTTFLRRCIRTLERALDEIGKHEDTSDTLYEICRAACVKEFELVLEQSGKLLKKRLAPFFASNLQADRLAFKDLFRHAARHGLMDPESLEHWFHYRDHRNDTAHEHGEDFAEATLRLLPAFIVDARSLADMIEATDDG